MISSISYSLWGLKTDKSIHANKILSGSSTGFRLFVCFHCNQKVLVSRATHINQTIWRPTRSKLWHLLPEKLHASNLRMLEPSPHFAKPDVILLHHLSHALSICRPLIRSWQLDAQLPVRRKEASKHMSLRKESARAFSIGSCICSLDIQHPILSL